MAIGPSETGLAFVPQNLIPLRELSAIPKFLVNNRGIAPQNVQSTISEITCRAPWSSTIQL